MQKMQQMAGQQEPQPGGNSLSMLAGQQMQAHQAMAQKQRRWPATWSGEPNPSARHSRPGRRGQGTGAKLEAGRIDQGPSNGKTFIQTDARRRADLAG
jgi:hypothetical protein